MVNKYVSAKYFNHQYFDHRFYFVIFLFPFHISSLSSCYTFPFLTCLHICNQIRTTCFSLYYITKVCIIGYVYNTKYHMLENIILPKQPFVSTQARKLFDLRSLMFLTTFLQLHVHITIIVVDMNKAGLPRRVFFSNYVTTACVQYDNIISCLYLHGRCNGIII